MGIWEVNAKWSSGRVALRPCPRVVAASRPSAALFPFFHPIFSHATHPSCGALTRRRYILNGCSGISSECRSISVLPPLIRSHALHPACGALTRRRYSRRMDPTSEACPNLGPFGIPPDLETEDTHAWSNRRSLPRPRRFVCARSNSLSSFQSRHTYLRRPRNFEKQPTPFF